MNGKVRKGRKMRKRLIIGMSGASGAPLTIELLKQLQQYKEIIETHLIVTKGAEMTLEQETDYTLEQLYAHADEVHDNYNIGAGPASGSYRTMGMIVIPCSMKTLAGIVSGYSDNRFTGSRYNLERTPEEDIITRKWAEQIWELVKQPVSVLAGVHYDNLEKEQLMEVIRILDQLLENLEQELRFRNTKCSQNV